MLETCSAMRQTALAIEQPELTARRHHLAKLSRSWLVAQIPYDLILAKNEKKPTATLTYSLSHSGEACYEPHAVSPALLSICQYLNPIKYLLLSSSLSFYSPALVSFQHPSSRSQPSSTKTTSTLHTSPLLTYHQHA